MKAYNKLLWKTLQNHIGHNVAIVSYGSKDSINDICLECEDCNEVILDAETCTICERTDL